MIKKRQSLIERRDFLSMMVDRKESELNAIRLVGGVEVANIEREANEHKKKYYEEYLKCLKDIRELENLNWTMRGFYAKCKWYTTWKV